MNRKCRCRRIGDSAEAAPGSAPPKNDQRRRDVGEVRACVTASPVLVLAIGDFVAFGEHDHSGPKSTISKQSALSGHTETLRSHALVTASNRKDVMLLAVEGTGEERKRLGSCSPPSDARHASTFAVTPGRYGQADAQTQDPRPLRRTRGGADLVMRQPALRRSCSSSTRNC